MVHPLSLWQQEAWWNMNYLQMQIFDCNITKVSFKKPELIKLDMPHTKMTYRLAS